MPLRVREMLLRHLPFYHTPYADTFYICLLLTCRYLFLSHATLVYDAAVFREPCRLHAATRRQEFSRQHTIYTAAADIYSYTRRIT